jgi:predicted RecB family nuclease
VSYSISKSSFLKFEQCSKSFFLYKKHPYLRDKLSIDKQLTFRRGHDIGYFAQQLFPGGTDVSKSTKNVLEAHELTKSLLEKNTPVIYEATFIFDGVLVMVDILHRDEQSYYAYEVKSSIKVSETYLRDACLQYFVLKNSLPGFEDLFLTTMNGDYVLDGELEPKKMFKKRSVKKEAENNLPYFEEKIKNAHLIIEQNAIPNVPIGKHCFKPYQCDFFGTCWKDVVNDESIFNLPLISKDKLFEWRDQGIKTIEELNDSMFDNEMHSRIRNSFASGVPIFQKEKIARLLNRIETPAAALDMEIWSSAIPAIQGTKPFQQVPFLFCISEESGESYFITDHKPDSRRQFARELIAQTLKYKTILVYDRTMEELALKGLKEIAPELQQELETLKNKFVDLFDIFKNLDYYNPAFKSNFSLKSVTEVFNTGITYSGIQSGLEAMNIYEQWRASEEDVDRKKLRNDLVEYCLNDARATYKLAQHLQNLIK